MSTIKNRLNEIPVYERSLVYVKAPLFNQIRLTRLRTGSPVRCALPSLSGLDVILTDDAWACVDRTINDIPVVAWTDFKTHDRSTLHEPIQVEQRIHHARAALIVGTVFAELAHALSRRLHPCADRANAS